MDDRHSSSAPDNGPDEPGDSGRHHQPSGDPARPERILHWRDPRTGRFVPDPRQMRMFS